MAIVRKGTVLEFDGKVRIEPGPVKKRAVATAELLSDAVTAEHYFAGTRTIEEGGKTVEKIGRDRLGKPIEMGKPIDYFDWKSPVRRFYLYRLVSIAKGKVDPITKKPTAVDLTRYMPAGPDEGFATEEAAMSAAFDLLRAEG